MILLVSGARPNFMKIAPLARAFKKERLKFKIIHTGQHYDYTMSKSFFEDLQLPEPDYYLDAGPGTHAEQTAKIMTAFEKVCIHEKPNLVVVVGDVNSTLACSITAKKLLVPVAHVEAGLRSKDMSMPEEINRIVTDAISDLLFATEKSAVGNLIKEGKDRNRIFLVGNIMIDNLYYQLKRLEEKHIPEELVSLKKSLGNRYIFLTLHRPSNVDNPERLGKIFRILNKLSEEIPIVFPVHPRTQKNISKFKIELSNNITTLQPLNFTNALFIWKDATAVITDSGGLQEETTALKVPCLTVRENTERPITVEIGSNTIVKDPQTIPQIVNSIVSGNYKSSKVPPLWDGETAKRIAKVISDFTGK